MAATVDSILAFWFPSSSPLDLWTRYIVPLWQHGTVIDYAKAIAIVVIALGILVVIPRLVSRRVTRSPRWLPPRLLKFLVRGGVTLGAA